MLFHVSKEAGIERFEPRPSQYAAESVVWAIDADHLCNYVFPREGPRVTFYAGRETTVADVEWLLGSSPAVIAVESTWLERLRSCRLFCYHRPAETFECIDECACYFLSRRPVVPAQIQVIEDLLATLLGRWALFDFTEPKNASTTPSAIVTSTGFGFFHISSW
jgi:hypothetical protein